MKNHVCKFTYRDKYESIPFNGIQMSILKTIKMCESCGKEMYNSHIQEIEQSKCLLKYYEILAGIYKSKEQDQSAKLLEITHDLVHSENVNAINFLFDKIDFDLLDSYGLISLLRSTCIYKHYISRWNECIVHTKNICISIGLSPEKELWGLLQKTNIKSKIETLIGKAGLETMTLMCHSNNKKWIHYDHVKHEILDVQNENTVLLSDISNVVEGLTRDMSLEVELNFVDHDWPYSYQPSVHIKVENMNAVDEWIRNNTGRRESYSINSIKWVSI